MAAILHQQHNLIGLPCGMHGVKKACGKTLIAGVVYVVALEVLFHSTVTINKNVRFIEPQKPKSTFSILFFSPDCYLLQYTLKKKLLNQKCLEV